MINDIMKIDVDVYTSLCNKEAFLECLFTSSKTAVGTSIPFETVRKNAMKLYFDEYGENFIEKV